jgi:dTDP-4-dehydrorhamnose reductase
VRILLTGRTGQVGYELERSLQGLGEIVAVDRKQMDLSDLDQVRDVIHQIKPSLIVNPAAYTAVDQAESEEALAMRINAQAPGVMAEEAKKLGAAMIHYSTDYVFDGSKRAPYVESDTPSPINVYGRTKWKGEQAIQATGIPHLILRTSWVYGSRGRNFLLTVLRLAQQRDELRIVDDQYGTPTWCRTIADTTAHLIAQAKCHSEWWKEKSGIYHLTAQGQTTWASLTEAILENTGLSKFPVVKRITTQEYPLPAQRPAYSVMSCQKLMNMGQLELPEWKKALRLCQS